MNSNDTKTEAPEVAQKIARVVHVIVGDVLTFCGSNPALGYTVLLALGDIGRDMAAMHPNSEDGADELTATRALKVAEIFKAEALLPALGRIGKGDA